MFSRHHSTSKEVFDINERIEEISSMIERSLTAANEVQLRLATDSLLTMANPGEFQDALLNLAINARDAMPKGGCYQISTKQVTLDNDHASPYGELLPGNYVRISLSDTGTGMAPEILEHIFEPFYTTKPKGKGTGLGLAMVYAFTRRYGGGIVVDSTLGKGTTFHLFLPVYVFDEPDSTVGSDSQAALPGGSETILLVDDEINLLKLAKTYLTAAGYNVLTAENATQALEVLQQHATIDLLLSDIVMPGGIDGYELASEAEKRRPGLKVLLTSGHAIEDETVRRDDYWVKTILKKPYSKTDILQAVRQVLDRDNT
jgi:CheY-like chemotaxis protein